MAQPRPQKARPVAAKRRRPKRGRLPTPEEAEYYFHEISRRLDALSRRMGYPPRVEGASCPPPEEGSLNGSPADCAKSSSRS
ncbi:hypothetical protein [Caulobacter sp. DWP3-1-3b2]|uniref:hypothetical protein n=1 Tax=Caulobacter sp. DWP3-1-3b2 TaxID=2804643 RepID=UPI003CF06734